MSNFSPEIQEEIIYISNNIDMLCISFRKEILQMIVCSGLEENKITEKGNGTQIKFSDLDINLIHNIYIFIYSKINSIQNNEF